MMTMKLRDGVQYVRYDKQIFFVSQSEEPIYDYDTGDYVMPEPNKDEAWANISDAGSERMQLVYGGLKQGALTIRIRNHYKKPFNYILFNDNKYTVDMERKLRHDHVFTVSEQL